MYIFDLVSHYMQGNIISEYRHMILLQKRNQQSTVLCYNDVQLHSPFLLPSMYKKAYFVEGLLPDRPSPS